jgi:hypothetical protein
VTDELILHRLRTERARLRGDPPPEQSSNVKRGPKHVDTVDAETFQVKGEDTIYNDPCDAVARARKLGAGSMVVRLSDGKLIAVVPGYIPAPPKEWTRDG